MTSGHFLFIPAILMIGFFLGFLFARQGAQDQVNRELARAGERDEARKRREEKRAKRKPGAARPGAEVKAKPAAEAKAKAKAKAKAVKAGAKSDEQPADEAAE